MINVLKNTHDVISNYGLQEIITNKILFESWSDDVDEMKLEVGRLQSNFFNVCREEQIEINKRISIIIKNIDLING